MLSFIAFLEHSKNILEHFEHFWRAGSDSQIIKCFILLFPGWASFRDSNSACGGQEGGAQAVHGEQGAPGGGAQDLASYPTPVSQQFSDDQRSIK